MADTAQPVDAVTPADHAQPADGAPIDVDTCPFARCTDSYCRTVGECCVAADCGGINWTCDAYHQCSCDDGTGLGTTCHTTVPCVAGDVSCNCYPGGDCCSNADCGANRCIGHVCEPI